MCLESSYCLHYYSKLPMFPLRKQRNFRIPIEITLTFQKIGGKNFFTFRVAFKYGMSDTEYIDLPAMGLKAWLYGHWHVNHVHKHKVTGVYTICYMTVQSRFITNIPCMHDKSYFLIGRIVTEIIRKNFSRNSTDRYSIHLMWGIHIT